MRNKKQGQKKATLKCQGVQKKPRFFYKKEIIPLALEEIRQGKGIAETSRKFSIPESTLRAKKLGLYGNKNPGPGTVLTEGEEKELEEWIAYCCDKGFPVTKNQLLESVRKIMCETKRKNPFVNNVPGRSWYEGFLRRHPNIATRVSEKVCLSRARVSEHGLREWFKEVFSYLNNKELLSIEPDRIFNCDETGISLNPIPSTVLAPKGHKNVCNIVKNDKENVTVLFTASAVGQLAPTFVLFAGKSLPDNAARMAPSDFAFGYSDNGWMTSQNFYEYIANVFEPWLHKINLKRPVILYIDGHVSHLTLHLSKFCSEHQILLIALPPNATHIMQPLDVSLFRTLKANWTKTCETFCKEALTVGVLKHQVAPLLKRTCNSMNLKTILENGFKKCGLCPFNADAINYNKVIRRIEKSQPPLIPENEPIHCAYGEDVVSNPLKAFENCLSQEQLKSFRLNLSPEWHGPEKDEGLFNVWYKLSKDYQESKSNCIAVGLDQSQPSSSVSGLSILNDAPSNCLILPWEVDQPIEDCNELMMDRVLPVSNESDIGVQKPMMNIVGKPVILSESYEELRNNNRPEITKVVATTLNLPDKPSECSSLIEENNLEAELPLNLSFGIVQIENKLANIPVGECDAPKEKCGIANAKKSLEINTFHDTTNVNKKDLQKSTNKTIQSLLFWPDDDLLNSKNKKRSINKLKMPTVVSSTQWQQIVETKQIEKRNLMQTKILKKKANAEKAEKQLAMKAEKEMIKLEKEKEKILKQQQRIEKEQEKLFKQQERLKEIEEKKRADEEKVKGDRTKSD